MGRKRTEGQKTAARQIRKEQKKGKKKLPKQVTELLPMTGYDREHSCYQMKGGKFMDLLQMASKDLVSSSASEVEYDCLKFCKMYKLYGDDLKLIVMNFPCNTKQQQAYLKRRAEKTTNQVFRQYLNRQIEELAWLEKHNETREFYLMLFAGSTEEMEENRRKVKAALHTGRDGLVAELPEEKKHQILYRMNNKCSQLL